LPPQDEYVKYISQIYAGGILTNQGPMVQSLEEKLRGYFGVRNLHYLANGTVALQLALAALDINDGEIITTPFSYVATTSSILWQRCTPVFVDIKSDNFTIDADLIESAITPKTRAIMGVHVFGYPCDVEKIQAIADKHALKVIYDGAHAFGAKLNGKSVFQYGDVSTLSFHATKLFHTVEGGACIVRDAAVSQKLDLQKRFGHHYDDHKMPGMNAKASEFHAAMGLANFPYIEKIMAARRHVCETYDKFLTNAVGRPAPPAGLAWNYAYYPVLFKNEAELLRVFAALNAADIFPRRYFHPSLNKLPYVESAAVCPVSEDIASRIACLPLYPDLATADIARISEIINKTIGR
jgi:dTDP-4-amino-4,6-dideoxygalactose transaminase